MVFCLLCAGHFVVFCVLHLTFLAKKWKRDGKNKSIRLNSKYKRSAPLLHTEAEGVRFSMSAESFQQHKTSFSYHKFSSPFWDELSAKQTERATLFYHFLSQNSKNFGKAIDFMKLKCYAMSMLNYFTILKFTILKHQRQGGLISPAVPEQEKENPP